MNIQYSIESIEKYIGKLNQTRGRIFLGPENTACLKVRN